MTTYEQIVELLQPFSGRFKLACSVHPETAAVITCPRCGTPMCDQCLQQSAAAGAVLCAQCIAAAAKQRKIGFIIAIFRLPAFWIILAMTLATIAYACHWMNPTLAEKTAIQSDLPWFQQSIGKLWLAQAERTQKRAMTLISLHKTATAAKWQLRAAGAFAKTAAFWHDTPVYNSLKIGEARSRGAAGETADAIEILEQLKIDPAAEIYPAYCYYLGQFYLKRGSQKQAMQFFHRAMSSAEIVAMKRLDNFIDLNSNDRRRARLIEKIRTITVSTIPLSLLKKLLAPYGIKAKRRKRRRRLNGLPFGFGPADDDDSIDNENDNSAKAANFDEQQTSTANQPEKSSDDKDSEFEIKFAPQ